jgi:hypothetical protein
MKERLKFRPIPANFGDRFPDGDYTVGRGADPRGAAERAAEAAAAPNGAEKPRKAKPRKRLPRVAAE